MSGSLPEGIPQFSGLSAAARPPPCDCRRTFEVAGPDWTCFLGFNAENGEWVRRLGARWPILKDCIHGRCLVPPPDTSCGASFTRPNAGSPLISTSIPTIAPTCVVLERVKVWPGTAERVGKGVVRRPTLTGFCASVRATAARGRSVRRNGLSDRTRN